MTTPRRCTFWIQALLILSCVALIVTPAIQKPVAKAPAKAPAKVDAKPPPKGVVEVKAEGEPDGAEPTPDPNADPTVETAKAWGEVYSLPSEGYDIIAKLKPPPCSNLAMPSVLVPAVDMAGCMAKSVLRQIAPSYTAGGADILGMGYVLDYGGTPSPETASAWFCLVAKFQHGYVWQGVYKTCSIEVAGEPYIGITVSTGMWVTGEYTPGQWTKYKQFSARTCS